MTVAIEVVEATGLIAEDGQGSSNPFVEVEFGGQTQRTKTKLKDLSPSWNETLFFNIHDKSLLPSLEINITVLHDDHHAATDCPVNSTAVGLRHRFLSTTSKQKAAAFLGHVQIPGGIIGSSSSDTIIRSFSLRQTGLSSNVCGSITIRAYFMQPAGLGMIDEYSIKETHPDIAAFHGCSSEKDGSRYDLVEQMEFLYVHIIKARGLPIRTNPYVEVSRSNYRRCTKYLDDNQELAQWNQVLAFPSGSENLGSNNLEITIRNKVKDEFIGRIFLDLAKLKSKKSSEGSGLPYEIKEGTDTVLSLSSERNGSSLEPQWYKLEDQHGEKLTFGEMMLAVWIGTQADKAFKDALHSYPDNITLSEQINSGPMVYYSPKLAYLRILAVGAKDLVSNDISRLTYAFLKAQLGKQLEQTTPVMFLGNANVMWNEELMFVISTSSMETIILTVIDRVAPNCEEELSSITLPISSIPHVRDIHESKLEPKWYDLSKCARRAQSCSKVQLCLSVDFRYHVFDESPEISSDFQPTAKELARPCIGRVELGIIKAKHLHAMKLRNGRSTTDAYCTAKYGQKWIRTCTIPDSSNPQWNEQYAWEVFDPCTVITIAVFDNCSFGVENCSFGDFPMGKVQIRLSTLESGRIYSHSYPLIKLLSSGIEKMGELQLVVRFTCTAWAKMISLYGKPPLPDVHYTQPISDEHLEKLRHSTKKIIAHHMSKSQPALPKEVVEYMVEPEDRSIWSLRKSKAKFFRVMGILSSFIKIYRWWNDLRKWKNPKITILVDALFVVVICYPWVISSGIFLYLCALGVWNYPFRPRNPQEKDIRLSHLAFAHPDELDEEFNAHSSPPDILRMRYDRLRSVAGQFQKVTGDLVIQGERLHALLTWSDPRASVACIIMLFIMMIILYITPFRVVVMIIGLYWLNCPTEGRAPSALYNFFRRIPSKTDMLIS